MTKNRLRKPTQLYHKGETPIEKNVRVIDEQGNEYEATYPKRAKGLVKHGRARFLSDDLICLACPPNSDDLEDSQMKDFLFHKRDDAQPTPVVPEAAGAPEVPVTPVAPAEPAASAPPVTPVAPEIPGVAGAPEAPEAAEPPKEEISTAYLLEQLEAVRKDSTHIQAAMDKIALMDIGEETKICAIREIAVSREVTNQQLIQTYSTLLSRKNPPKMPNFDSWGKKWNELKDKAKTTVEMNFTPEQDAEIKRQIDEAAQDIQDATRNVDETIRRSIDKAVEVIRQAAKGTKEAYDNWTASVHQAEPAKPERAKKADSVLDMVTELLRDPNLSMEEKELIFAHIEDIRDVDEVTQAKVLEILGDITLSVEEKELILNHLEDLQELS